MLLVALISKFEAALTHVLHVSGNLSWTLGGKGGKVSKRLD